MSPSVQTGTHRRGRPRGWQRSLGGQLSFEVSHSQIRALLGKRLKGVPDRVPAGPRVGQCFPPGAGSVVPRTKSRDRPCGGVDPFLQPLDMGAKALWQRSRRHLTVEVLQA